MKRVSHIIETQVLICHHETTLCVCLCGAFGSATFFEASKRFSYTNFFLSKNTMSSIAERGLVHLKRLYAGDLSRRLGDRVALSTVNITKLQVDAIVNAANSSLLGGGGVDGAIHAAAGPELVAECKTLHGCKAGDAKITKGYKLPAKHVIHTVGPQDGNEKVLQSCYERSLQVLDENDLHTIAFPCIATGVYGFDNEKAANIALAVVRSYLEKKDSVTKVIFSLFNEKDIKIYKELLPIYFDDADTSL
ncbi:hypothetical protein BCR43DRAFT_486928 [Syncephalastrum racemosum]|uniref:Macro domain-containing protein n=1 Tax=Syncephalastrum racemosum TaxID=13706 RepID=A0A1X2HQ29_SYNRA|nr:hypothetical protein BCR43DRAFT_486928 [Syncephalastrum racemosum]